MNATLRNGTHSVAIRWQTLYLFASRSAGYSAKYLRLQQRKGGRVV
jgi:hypothetical protein